MKFSAKEIAQATHSDTQTVLAWFSETDPDKPLDGRCLTEYQNMMASGR